VKGNVYLGTQAFFTAKVPGGLGALHASIDDPSLLAFIKQKFLPCAWYDVLPAVPLIRAEAKAMGLSVRRYLLARSGYQASQDLAGVYRIILKIASASQIGLRLPQLFTQVFDFGKSDSNQAAPGHVEAHVRDFPLVLFEWFSTSLEVYASEALRLTGARERVVTTRKVESATRSVVPLASLRVDLRWKV
jgi:hypothetical protein